MLKTLHDEIVNDPLSRGYSGMSNAQIATSLNTANRTRTATHLAGSVIYEQIVVSEYLALTAEQKAEVWDIIHLGENIDVRPGSKARTRFISLFGAGSGTINAIASVLNTSISRAEELGLGVISEGLVAEAKAYTGG